MKNEFQVLVPLPMSQGFMILFTQWVWSLTVYTLCTYECLCVCLSEFLLAGMLVLVFARVYVLVRCACARLPVLMLPDIEIPSLKKQRFLEYISAASTATALSLSVIYAYQTQYSLISIEPRPPFCSVQKQILVEFRKKSKRIVFFSIKGGSGQGMRLFRIKNEK